MSPTSTSEIPLNKSAASPSRGPFSFSSPAIPPFFPFFTIILDLIMMHHDALPCCCLADLSPRNTGMKSSAHAKQ